MEQAENRCAISARRSLVSPVARLTLCSARRHHAHGKVSVAHSQILKSREGKIYLSMNKGQIIYISSANHAGTKLCPHKKGAGPRQKRVRQPTCTFVMPRSGITLNHARLLTFNEDHDISRAFARPLENYANAYPKF